MQGRARATTALLSLLLVFTQTSCIYVAYFSQKVKQMTAGNEGVLVAAPGTKLADLRHNSTLSIGQGSGSLSKESKHRLFLGSKRFDWQLPDSNLLFKNCNSYAISTDDETGETITDMQVGTAERYFTWAEVKEQMYDLERRLLADGWKPVVRDGESSSDRMHKKLENPDFNQMDDSMRDAGYEKGDVGFTSAAKRARGARQAKHCRRTKLFVLRSHHR